MCLHVTFIHYRDHCILLYSFHAHIHMYIAMGGHVAMETYVCEILLLPTHVLCAIRPTRENLSDIWKSVKTYISVSTQAGKHRVLYLYVHVCTCRSERSICIYSPMVLAKPKSQSLTTPLLEMRMFSGFTSRWIIWSWTRGKIATSGVHGVAKHQEQSHIMDMTELHSF